MNLDKLSRRDRAATLALVDDNAEPTQASASIADAEMESVPPDDARGCDIDAYCEVTVRKAGEAPQACGLELPCPRHRQMESHPSIEHGRRATEAAGRALGEHRDV